MSRSWVVSVAAAFGVAGAVAVMAGSGGMQGGPSSGAPSRPPASSASLGAGSTESAIGSRAPTGVAPWVFRPGASGAGAVGSGAEGVSGSVSGAAPRSRAAPRWHWPLAPRPPVLRRFRAPPSPWAAGHRGLDLAARPGDDVLAVAPGTVTHRGTVAGRGTVTVLHSDGLRSTYEPVDASVSVGEVVTTGQRLGVVQPGAGASATHCGPRVCLHLGARRGDEYLDPWPLLARGRLALLPLP